MTIIDILDKNAKLYANDIAISYISNDIESQLTWLEFDGLANKTANALIANGIRCGDKVSILMNNCLEWLPIYFGILKVGAIAVCVNTRNNIDEILYCLNLVECSCTIYAHEFCASEVLSAIQKQYVTISASDVDVFSSSKPNVNILSYDLAAIYFSSGTTGQSKAVLHKHSALMNAARVENIHHKQIKDDVFLCIPPLFHTGAFIHWLGSFLVGGSVVIIKNTSPKKIIEIIEKKLISITWLLLIWVQDIVDAIECGDINIENYDLKKWRLMHMGAQPIPRSLILQWNNLFPNQQIDVSYGLTESAGPGCVHLGVDNISMAGSIGKPGFGWEVKIVNEDGIELDNNEIGELAIMGEGLMVCYYNDPVSSKIALRDNWLFTGDLGYKDENGFIFLVGRKKDIIISGGENIYPIQIESHIKSYFKVKDVAIIGLPDRRYGEIIVAIIELKTHFECDKREILKFCIDIPKYKWPHKIFFDRLPRNALNKVDKNKLRERYMSIFFEEQIHD